MKLDYSLYLVTDSTPAILGQRDICQVVEAAVKGGRCVAMPFNTIKRSAGMVADFGAD